MVLHWMSVGVTGATCIPSPWQDMRGTALDECGSDGSDLHQLSSIIVVFWLSYFILKEFEYVVREENVV